MKHVYEYTKQKLHFLITNLKLGKLEENKSNLKTDNKHTNKEDGEINYKKKTINMIKKL